MRWTNTLLAAAMVLALTGPPTAVVGAAPADQAAPTTIAGIKGRCESVSLAGAVAACAPSSGVVYTALSNGRVLFSFALADGRVASFIGEKDSQPRPQEYFLYLSRIRIASKGSDFSSNIAGQCKVSMSRDGSIWSTIDCNATDENSAVYGLRFVGDGTPVKPEHPGSKPAADQVDQKTVAQVTGRFKVAMGKGGIHYVAQDVAKCFDDSFHSIPATRICMLYDISAVTLDKDMRKLFVSRGVNVGPKTPFLDDLAFNTRMEIYSGIAFGGSQDAANKFFAGAPGMVISGLSK